MSYNDLQVLQFQTPNEEFESDNYIQININDFEKICRTCLSSHEIQSIFDLKYNDTMVLDLLLSCTSLEVS